MEEKRNRRHFDYLFRRKGRVWWKPAGRWGSLFRVGGLQARYCGRRVGKLVLDYFENYWVVSPAHPSMTLKRISHTNGIA